MPRLAEGATAATHAVLVRHISRNTVVLGVGAILLCHYVLDVFGNQFCSGPGLLAICSRMARSRRYIVTAAGSPGGESAAPSGAV